MIDAYCDINSVERRGREGLTFYSDLCMCTAKKLITF